MDNSENIGLCQFCLQEKKLIEAHIIPKWVFRANVDKPGEDSYILSNEGETVETRKSRGSIGPYDDGILCADCDNSMSTWENHFKTHFYTPFNGFEKRIADNNLPIVFADGFCANTLSLFFLSILWRASISSHTFYRNVDLGSRYEERLKNIISNRKIERFDEFPIMGKYYQEKDEKASANSKMGPLRVKYDGINYYTLIMLGFEFAIKVDNKPLKDGTDPYWLGKSEKWPIPAKVFTGSNVHKIMYLLSQGEKKLKRIAI